MSVDSASFTKAVLNWFSTVYEIDASVDTCFNDIALDSLDLIELEFDMERMFSIEFEAQVDYAYTTVKEFIDQLYGRIIEQEVIA